MRRGGYKYYLGEDGVMLVGEQEIEGKQYYFYSDGHMAESNGLIINIIVSMVNIKLEKMMINNGI